MKWSRRRSDRELLNSPEIPPILRRILKIVSFFGAFVCAAVSSVVLYCSYAEVADYERPPDLLIWLIGFATGEVLFVFIFLLLFESKLRRQSGLLQSFFRRLDELGELDDDGKLKPRA